MMKDFIGDELEAAVVFHTVVTTLSEFYSLPERANPDVESGVILMADALLRQIWPVIDLKIIGPGGLELRRTIARAAFEARRHHGIEDVQ